MIYKVLFYIDDRKLQVYTKRNQEFESVLFEGEQNIALLEEDFWRWWEETLSFCINQDELDYCMITDESIKLDFDRYKTIKQSKWCTWELEKFCMDNIEFAKVELANIKGTTLINTRNKLRMFSENKSKRLNIIMEDDVFNEKEEIEYINVEQGSLREYYLNNQNKQLR